MHREGSTLRWVLLLFVVTDAGVFLGRKATGHGTAALGAVSFGSLIGLLCLALILGLLRRRSG